MSAKSKLFETLDLHLGQIEWSKHPSAGEWMEDFITAEDMRGEGKTLGSSATGAAVMKDEYRVLDAAQTYYVEQDMIDMVTYASFNVPRDVTLESTDIPSTAGFAVFENAVMIRDSKGNALAFGAVSWSIEALIYEDPTAPPEVKGLRLSLYTDPWDERDSGHLELTESLRRTRQAGLPIPPFMPTHLVGVPFGDQRPLYKMTYDENPGWSDEHGFAFVDSAAFLFTFFKLIVQEVAAIGRHRASRPELRRANRMGHIPMDGMIRTVVLRRSKPKVKRSDDEEREAPMWSHRWPVRGFWRTYHKGKPNEFQGWVRPYIKPNDDLLPLVLKDLIYNWKR